ncbi:hypothetical protein FNV43_RR20626 [Rhamnella rubrinervis]|uniref:Uncharacterized protein n=1 Tax=Rhamnella rubrinervis TaxID=2594499 RepID=A0A8K0DV57_9ROSA|nr:hypothetical protein FNV43_RR20626 [Rhamnella rubrinervis]
MENIVTTMILGRSKGDDRYHLKEIAEEVLKILGAFNLADFVPFIGALDLQWLHSIHQPPQSKGPSLSLLGTLGYEKLQEELQNVIGMDQMVEEKNLGKLSYLEMVVKETFRLYPVASFLVPESA